MKNALFISTILISGLITGPAISGNEKMVPALRNTPSPSVPLSRWAGGDFRNGEGGFFVKIIRKSGMENTRFIEVAFKNVDTGVKHLFKYRTKATTRFWRLPAGEYLVDRISLRDDEGTNRVWDGKMRGFKIVVRENSLSVLGTWVIVTLGKQRLIPKFRASIEFLTDANRISPAVDLIDGITGEQIPGKGDEAKSLPESSGKIETSYTLNLYRYNDHAKPVKESLDKISSEFGLCYQSNTGRAGNMKFRFLLSEPDKMMKRIVYSGGSLRNPNLVSCIQRSLTSGTYHIKKSMIGEVNLVFSARD